MVIEQPHTYHGYRGKRGISMISGSRLTGPHRERYVFGILVRHHWRGRYLQESRGKKASRKRKVIRVPINE